MQKGRHTATAATQQTEGDSRVVTTGSHHADDQPSLLILAYQYRAGPHTVYTFAYTEEGTIFGGLP